MEPARVPGFAAQEKYRTLFRVSGVVVFGTGLVLTVIAFVDFFSGFGDMSGMPTKFFLAFIGMPLMGLGSWLLQAGFIGVAARYAAGETMPVVKDSASYLTDGRGIGTIGRTDDPVAGTGPYCRACGVRNDGDARYCDGCGQSIG